MRRPELPIAEVTARVTSLLGRSVADAVEVAGSVTNQNVGLRLADGTRVLVKIGQREQLRGEAWILDRVATVGVPVPGVIATEHDTEPPLNVLGWIDGSPSEQPSVLAETGRRLAVLHGIEAVGYGPLEVGASGARGVFDRWADFLAAELSGLSELRAAGLLTEADVRGVRSATAASPAAWPGTGVLLHGDLKRLHVLERDGRLAGLIDWGDPVVGDPRWDLARLSMMGDAALRAVLSGYDRDLGADLDRVLIDYRVIWNVSALTYEYRAGGDWFDAYRDRLRTDLDRLDG